MIHAGNENYKVTKAVYPARNVNTEQLERDILLGIKKIVHEGILADCVKAKHMQTMRIKK